jgi:hypothetical protein
MFVATVASPTDGAIRNRTSVGRSAHRKACFMKPSESNCMALYPLTPPVPMVGSSIRLLPTIVIVLTERMVYLI